MADAEKKTASKANTKEFPAQIFAEDMAEDWSKDAVKIARYCWSCVVLGSSLHNAISINVFGCNRRFNLYLFQFSLLRHYIF